MNVASARVVLRPRGTGEILDLTGLIVGRHALRLYAWLSLWVLVPCFAASLGVHYLLDGEWVHVWLVAFTLSSLAQGVFTIAAGRWLFAEELKVKDVLRAFMRRAFGFSIAWASRTVLMVLASMGVVMPAVVGAVYLFTPEASLLEMAGPFDALGRSRNFTKSSFGRALGMWLSLVTLMAVILLIVHTLCHGLVSDVLQFGNPFGEFWNIGESPYAVLGLMLSAPYIATARFLMYIDGRTRGDGWDIQVRFMAIAQEREEQSGRLLGLRGEA